VLWLVWIGCGPGIHDLPGHFGAYGDPFAGRTFADFPRPSLTAVVFGLALAVAGLVMGLIYLKQQRLVPLTIGHALWDFLGIGVLSGVLPLVVARE
jgi:membrane protease YdiL (CAAX protease family)